MPMTRLTAAALVAAALAVAAPVHASVLFTFQRISDSQAILTATGMPDTGFPTGPNDGFFSGLTFEFLTDGFFGGGPLVGDFAFGSIPIVGLTADLGEVTTPALFNDDDSPSGSAFVTLQGGVDWAPIGASNRVLSDYFPGPNTNSQEQTDIQIGTWEMIAPIPLPAAAWMLLAGAGALGAVARKRKG